MTERLWVRTPSVETIFQAPSKLGTKFVETWHCCICCNPANGRVDFVEWLAYKIPLHGNEWFVSLSADWDQSPKKKKLKSSTIKKSSFFKQKDLPFFSSVLLSIFKLIKDEYFDNIFSNYLSTILHFIFSQN